MMNSLLDLKENLIMKNESKMTLEEYQELGFFVEVPLTETERSSPFIVEKRALSIRSISQPAVLESLMKSYLARLSPDQLNGIPDRLLRLLLPAMEE